MAKLRLDRVAREAVDAVWGDLFRGDVHVMQAVDRVQELLSCERQPAIRKILDAAVYDLRKVHDREIGDSRRVRRIGGRGDYDTWSAWSCDLISRWRLNQAVREMKFMPSAGCGLLNNQVRWKMHFDTTIRLLRELQVLNKGL